MISTIPGVPDVDLLCFVRPVRDSMVRLLLLLAAMMSVQDQGLSKLPNYL